MTVDEKKLSTIPSIKTQSNYDFVQPIRDISEHDNSDEHITENSAGSDNEMPESKEISVMDYEDAVLELRSP